MLSRIYTRTLSENQPKVTMVRWMLLGIGWFGVLVRGFAHRTSEERDVEFELVTYPKMVSPLKRIEAHGIDSLDLMYALLSRMTS